MEDKVGEIPMESCTIINQEVQEVSFGVKVAEGEGEGVEIAMLAKAAPVACVAAESPKLEEVKRLEEEKEIGEGIVLKLEDNQDTQMQVQSDAQVGEEQDKIDFDKETPQQQEPAQAPQQIQQHQVQDSHQQQPEETQLDDKSASLGRNRRVRQKNRYFLDFHCIDLTKGARSVKDDYESAFSAATSTRRSTTDSSRNQNDEPVVFETRYCRRCLMRTPHDLRHEGGACQACLYNEIVESHKKLVQTHNKLNHGDEKHQRQRQRPASQRNRSGNSKQQHDNELGTSNTTATSSSNGNKRKAKQRGFRISNSASNNNNSNNNTANNANTDIITDNNNINNTNNTTTTTTTKTNDSKNININNNCNNSTIIGGGGTEGNNNTDGSSHTICNNSVTKTDIDSNKLPRLDLWTPDEVAEYIMSKGFAHEAELFKTQSVDGISLLLMQRTDFTYGLKIKLGPALKIYDQVCRLKKEYFRELQQRAVTRL